LNTSTGLEKTTVCSSGASAFSIRANNFISSFAPWARTQASRPPTKFLKTNFETSKFWGRVK